MRVQKARAIDTPEECSRNGDVWVRKGVPRVVLLLALPSALWANVLPVHCFQLLHFPAELVLCTFKQFQQKVLVHLDKTHDTVG